MLRPQRFNPWKEQTMIQTILAVLVLLIADLHRWEAP